MRTEIEEHNIRLIAQFYGGEYYAFKDSRGKILSTTFKGSEVFDLPKGYNPRLNFDSSWDSLIPVIKRIIKMENSAQGNLATLANLSLHSDFNTFYNHVVSFIVWYNKTYKKYKL